MLRQIQTSHAPAAIGPYSQAVVHGGLVYCSGSLGVVPSTGQFIAGGIEEQVVCEQHLFHDIMLS